MRGYVIFSFVLLFTMACSTQKQRGQVSKFKKSYHNTTALYNGYFNANLIMEESFLALESQVSENYNQPLPLYKYTSATNPQALYNQLDRAIEKVSVVVHLHRVSDWTDDSYLLMAKAQFLKQDYESAQETLEYFLQEFDETGQSKSAKKKIRKAPSASNNKERKQKVKSAEKAQKEKAKATEDARKDREKQRQADAKARQKGSSSSNKSKKIDPKQAQAIREARREQARQDSIAAAIAANPDLKNTIPVQETTKQKDTAEKSKSKSKEAPTTPTGQPINPDNYFMKHKPCYQEAVLWLAKTYIMRGNYDNARLNLKQLENSGKTTKEVRAEVYAVEAFSFIRQKNYSAAIQPLTKAVDLTSNRQTRARYTFILAQLQELEGAFGDALENFEKVVKIHPGFEMEFHAEMGAIRNKQLSGKVGPEAVASDLRRMLKEKKFEDFKGELNLNLAVLSFKKGDENAGMEYLNAALSEGRNNAATNAEVHYLLATNYFKNEDYVRAKTHYDGVLSTMNNTDERYPICQRRANSLTEIAANIKIITEKDSLLQVAQLSAEEKKELAMELKKKREKDLLSNNTNTDKKGGAPLQLNLSAVGNRNLFFAYDQKNTAKNKRDFDRVWQSRPLEDDWRRSSRSNASFASAEESSTGTIVRGSKGISDKEMEDLLSGVPKDEKEINAAQEAVMKAMFALGGLFNDKLENLDQSTLYLEQLVEKFPKNPHEADAFYRLYINHKSLGNTQRSEYFKNKILQDYPGSLYAEVIRDPDYFRKKREEENKLNNYYASTYDFFTKGNYEKAYDMSSQATNLFGPDNNLKAKFALLRAMCIGNIQGLDAYSLALREMIARYPDSQEQIRAREILRLLGQRIGGLPDEKPSIASQANLFTPSDNEMHYIIIALQSPNLTLNDAKVKVSNYNNKYHRLDQLKISNIVLGEKNNIPVVVLRKFDNAVSAMKYFDSAQKNRKDFLSDPSQYELFAISQTNYRQLITARSIEPYREFFVNQYMKK
jgi:tetratricopeptide (TPR) repeat protein